MYKKNNKYIQQKNINKNVIQKKTANDVCFFYA